MKTNDTMRAVRKAWLMRKPFFLTATVVGPYDGCFYEPNIFLVTPKGCPLQKELMASIRPRYTERREAANCTM